MTDLKSRLIGGSRNIDMTQGDIFLHLLRFALPLLAGNIFQQLYNTVDTWIRRKLRGRCGVFRGGLLDTCY